MLQRVVRPSERAPRGRRFGTRLQAAVFLTLLLASPAVSQTAPVKGEVSATTANGFARLVFNMADEVPADVRAQNGIVVIAFQRPVAVAADRIAAGVPDYVAVARRDPGGEAVRLALRRKVTVNAMAAGERLYVDLLPDGWVGAPPGLPQEVVEELARRAREAEARVRRQERHATRKPAARVRVRVAEMPTFTRYTFELPELIATQTERTKDAFSVSFDAPLAFDLADAKAALPATVSTIDSAAGDETTAVRFTLKQTADLRTFREDNAFVVDITPTEGKDAATRRGEPAAENPPPSHDAPSPIQNRVQQAAEASPAMRPATPLSPQLPAAQTLELTAPPSISVAVPQASVAPPRAPAPTAPSSDAEARAQRSVRETVPEAVHAVMRRQGDTLRLVFPFRMATAAAVFQRGDALWMVFDSDAPIDIAQLQQDQSGTLGEVTASRSGAGQVVRARLKRPRLSTVTPDGDFWIVALGSAASDPIEPLGVSRSFSPTAAVSFRLAGASTVHRLADPDGGDRLVAITAPAPARGLIRPQEFVEFHALASAHGVAIAPLADDVQASIVPDAVTVGRPGGLVLAAGGSGGQHGRSGGFYKPAVWESDRQAEFTPRERALQQAAADAPEAERADARLDLARFYMAREFYVEAKAVLDATVTATKAQDDLAAALLLRAASNVLLDRAEAAIKDLAQASLTNHDDALLWRALAHARQGRFADANVALKASAAATADLPFSLQRIAVRDAARSALEAGDLAEASRRLSEFDGLGVPPEMKGALALMSARLAEKLGRVDDALGGYRTAGESFDPAIAAQAKLRETALRYASGKLPRREAEAAFEQVAAGWRGDASENEALQQLARLYVEDARYRDALQTMRIAQGVFAASATTDRMQDEAAATFEQLFLGERANSLSPIDALSLFYDFRELTPIGRRGDEMIRRLAERLIAMDLLGQASDLLQHQVDHRLQGAARAQVATRLATVYLINRRPDRALNLLRASRLSDASNEMRQQRLLVEARALSHTGRHDVALEVVANLDGREVERLRADIHWAARRWQKAAERIEGLYGERWRDFRPLDAAESADILRAAVGYALGDDVLGLDRFRQKYAAKLAEGPERRMFDVLTAPQHARGDAFRELAKTAASVDTLSAFLRDLRARFPDAAPTAAATPQARS